MTNKLQNHAFFLMNSSASTKSNSKKDFFKVAISLILKNRHANKLPIYSLNWEYGLTEDYLFRTLKISKQQATWSKNFMKSFWDDTKNVLESLTMLTKLEGIWVFLRINGWAHKIFGKLECNLFIKRWL